MTTKPILAISGVLLLASVSALGARTEAVRIERTAPSAPGEAARPVVFVCLNGVAMSVWSAAYFNRLAEARGLPERAIARASIPSYTAVPFSMRFGLALDGFRVADFHPHVMDEEDARSAALVVAIDTELPEQARSTHSAVERWNGFPPMRERYFPSRAALKQRVERLVDRLAAKAD